MGPEEEKTMLPATVSLQTWDEGGYPAMIQEEKMQGDQPLRSSIF